MARPKIICMIPARIGSQRIPEKNLAPMGPTTLLGNAISIALQVPSYDEVWVNTHDERLVKEAERHGARVHIRPQELALSGADLAFKHEFFERHNARYIVNHNPTAPLLKPATCEAFCELLLEGRYDTLHSVKQHQASFLDADGCPINFSRETHLQTQELPPVYEACWALVGWHRAAFLAAECGVWKQPMGMFVLSDVEATQVRHGPEELRYAQWLIQQPR